MQLRRLLDDIERAFGAAFTPRKSKRWEKEGRYAYTGEVSWLRAIVRKNDAQAKQDAEKRREERQD